MISLCSEQVVYCFCQTNVFPYNAAYQPMTMGCVDCAKAKRQSKLAGDLRISPWSIYHQWYVEFQSPLASVQPTKSQAKPPISL